MGDMNSEKNCAVWFDLPVKDLHRAMAFYEGVLGRKVFEETFGNFKFAIIDHKDGNGGCLVVEPDNPTSTGGILVYMNVDGRIQEACKKVVELGGVIKTQPHSIGPHGFRAVAIDSEGNRIALHSNSDS